MSSSSPVKKKAKLEKGLKLTELPNEVLDIIFHHVESPSIVNLVNAENHSSPKLLTVVQEWECAECNRAIFDASTETSKTSLSIPPGAKPFLCGGACGRKSCGHHRCESGPGYTCPGCSKVECHLCMHQHIHCCATCSGKWTNGRYCTECQGTCDKECRLCRRSICQHHGDRCDKCGVVSCGIHEYSVSKCDHCQISLCGGCNNHGDGMFRCRECKKGSCNANGTGRKECPAFHFDIALCANCCFGASNGDCCDKCGVKTCACLDSSLDKCDYCETSICIRCQEDENHMWLWGCICCGTHSCNAGGSGSSGCPVLDFDINENGLCPKCVVEYQEDEEDGDTSTSGTGERGEENEGGEECQTNGGENRQEKETDESV